MMKIDRVIRIWKMAKFRWKLLLRSFCCVVYNKKELTV